AQRTAPPAPGAAGICQTPHRTAHGQSPPHVRVRHRRRASGALATRNGLRFGTLANDHAHLNGIRIRLACRTGDDTPLRLVHLRPPLRQQLAGTERANRAIIQRERHLERWRRARVHVPPEALHPRLEELPGGQGDLDQEEGGQERAHYCTGYGVRVRGYGVRELHAGSGAPPAGGFRSPQAINRYPVKQTLNPYSTAKVTRTTAVTSFSFDDVSFTP